MNDQVPIEELQENFNKLNLIGKAFVTTMMMWESLSSSKNHLDHETKTKLLMNHLKMLELAAEWEALQNATRLLAEHGNGEFRARIDSRLDEALNELKFVQHNIDILEGRNDQQHH